MVNALCADAHTRVVVVWHAPISQQLCLGVVALHPHAPLCDRMYLAPLCIAHATGYMLHHLHVARATFSHSCLLEGRGHRADFRSPFSFVYR